MFVDEFLKWVQDGMFRVQGPDRARVVIGLALQELQSLDPHQVDPRVACLKELASGPISEIQLRATLADWDGLCTRAETQLLEAEFRDLARRLVDEEWETELYLQISDAIAD